MKLGDRFQAVLCCSPSLNEPAWATPADYRSCNCEECRLSFRGIAYKVDAAAFGIQQSEQWSAEACAHGEYESRIPQTLLRYFVLPVFERAGDSIEVFPTVWALVE